MNHREFYRLDIPANINFRIFCWKIDHFEISEYYKTQLTNISAGGFVFVNQFEVEILPQDMIEGYIILPHLEHSIPVLGRTVRILKSENPMNPFSTIAAEIIDINELHQDQIVHYINQKILNEKKNDVL